MYRPVQIPQILDPLYSQNISYSEDYDERAQGFAICFWEMQPKGKAEDLVSNVIVTDGCIDLVVGFDEQTIGFSGMSETVYDYQIDASQRFMGVRLKPGSFTQLTGLRASKAMDNFLLLEDFDPSFDSHTFFSLSFDKAQAVFKTYVLALMDEKEPDEFVSLFDTLTGNTPSTVLELCKQLHFSPRQGQRLFMEHFGYSPQKALSILRFQHYLDVLTSKKASPSDLLSVTHYCDQSHCIKDFKKHIGLTPLELLARYS